ncbi:interferon-induced very large GTPase 1-like [Thraustotheca clavata]|uniref:Interferon-induced very large GTPase 1-like n=1 Tax=Thraustotheca clavata TaxID=74557 RepID=A0A1V9YVF3_9STRA|nr:interferon-induced very large GTPase 1-like [Thraustotheca clavata]
MGANLEENESGSLQVDLEETLDACQKLEDALGEGDEESISSTSLALNAVTSKLGLDEWFIDEAKLKDQLALVKCLQALKTELSRFGRDIGSNQVSEAETVSMASGGSALRGVYLGHDLTRASRPILQQPTSCSFVNPSNGFASEELIFTSFEEANNFRKTMNTNGKSFALGLNGSIGFIHGGVSGKFESTKTKQQETLKVSVTKYLAHITYAYVPIKSFCFSKSLMNISDDAKEAASDIENDHGAETFLDDFGSHVSCGEYQFGGIFWKVVEMTATKETSSVKMLDECRKHMSGKLSVGYRPLGFGLNIDCQPLSINNDKVSSSDENQYYAAQIMTKIECTGPEALSYEIFRRTLEVNNQSWHLIDRPISPNTLVPVWEILAKDSKFEQQAELLREVWLKKAQTLKPSSWMQNLMQRARVKAWLGNPQFGTENKNKAISSKEDAELIVRQECKRVCALDFSCPNTGDEVVGLFLLLLRVDMEFNLDLTIDCLRQKCIHNLLKIFTSSNERKAMQSLSALFENVINAKLTHATPPVQIDTSIYEALHKSTQLAALGDNNVEWEAPSVDVDEIPKNIDEIAQSILSASIPDMHLLTRRIGDFLIKNLIADKLPKHKELWEIASRYGCRDDGFINDLKANEVVLIISEMRAVLDHKVVIDESSDDDAGMIGMIAAENFDWQMNARPTTADGTPLKSLLIVSPRPDIMTNLPGLILYTLKHRLNIVKEIYADEKLPLATTKQPMKGKLKGPVVFDELLQLVKSLTPMARAEVYRLLLDRRFLVPFLIPLENSKFQCETTALDLIDTLTTSGRSSIVKNVDALRVAVISQRSTDQVAQKNSYNFV